MLSIEEKRFYANTAWGASSLSSCPTKCGAVIARGDGLISSGYNRRLLKDKNWEISAIYDAILKARDIDLSRCTLFSTYFPSIDDLKLIVATGISTIYFFGIIDNQETVSLINNLNKESIPLELIHLKDKKDF
jgi:deoxycytidylate deaminase